VNETAARAQGARLQGWCFVTRKYPPAVGGMERLSYELTTRLSSRVPVTVVAMQPRAMRLPGFLVIAAIRLFVGCATRRVTLVHLGDAVLAPLALIPRAFGLPTVVTLHGLDVVHGSAVYRIWRKLFLRGFDHYVCNSEATLAAATAAGVPAERTSVIGVGVDVPEPLPVPATRDMNCLLFVGRLVRRKGLAWFVADVLPALAARHPGLYVAVLGDGPERASIIAAAQRAGVQDRLRWLGALSDADKAAWLARAAICVMPNVQVENDLEGYGIVALEGAAAGCAVVAADIDGLRAAVDDGRSGTLVPSADASAWIRALDARLCDASATIRAGEAAREHVRENRGWNEIIDAHERLFARIAAEATLRCAR